MWGHTNAIVINVFLGGKSVMFEAIHSGILAVSNVLYQPWFVPLLLVVGGLYFTF